MIDFPVSTGRRTMCVARVGLGKVHLDEGRGRVNTPKRRTANHILTANPEHVNRGLQNKSCITIKMTAQYNTDSQIKQVSYPSLRRQAQRHK